jgi:hypothetical protein
MGADTRRGTASRSPTFTALNGVHPSSVRNEALAAASVSRPEASRSVNTSFRPLGSTLVIGCVTIRLRSSSDHTSGRSPLRISSPIVTSEPLSAHKIRI